MITVPLHTVDQLTTLQGSRLKGVTCEGCGQQYAYLMVREGVGVCNSRYSQLVSMLGDLPAPEEELRNHLRWDSDVAPCPRCLSVQEDMRQQRISRSVRKWLRWETVVAGIAMVAVLGLVLKAPVVWIMAAATAGAILGLQLLFFVQGKAWGLKQLSSPFFRAEPANPNVWTREQLEAAVREGTRIDISRAALDWEVQNKSRELSD